MIQHLDLTLDDGAANLAVDEALLDCVEEANPAGNEGVLRFYEPKRPCVVVGYGNRVASEVDVEACASEGVPILRRISGGGTVVLGPGCLAYALVLPIRSAPALETVTGTNRFVMERHRQALSQLLGRPVEVQGYTDLTVENRKFSGNAQRRRRHAVLFHGTFLLRFDLAAIGRWLRKPSAEPTYRADREHGSFVVNLDLPTDPVKAALRAAWGAGEPHQSSLDATISRLMTERYGDPTWHRRW